MGNNDLFLKLQEEASTTRMFWSSFIIILPSLSFGIGSGFSAIAQPYYQHPNATTLDSPLTEEGSSWFVSILPLALTGSALFSGFLSESIGRRKTLILGNLLQMAGWIVIYFSLNLTHLILGRIVNGFGCGLIMTSSYNLLSEIALVRFRGLLACINNLSFNAGVMLVMFLGSVFDFSLLVPLSMIPNWMFLFLSFNLPESPLWLVKGGREKECLAMLEKIRGYNYSGIQVEMNELVFCACKKDDKVSLSEKLRYLSSGPVLKPLALSVCLMCFPVASGIDAIYNYPLDVLERSNVTMDNYVVAFALQMMFPLGVLVASPIMYRMSRKRQFSLSCLAIAAGLIVFALSLYMKNHFPSQLTGYFEILLPFSFITLSLSFAMGMGPVGFALLGELFPPKATEICSGIAITVRYLTSALSLKTYPFLANTLGVPLLFVVHALLTLGAALFVLYLVPETQGLTLTQLSQLFTPKNTGESVDVGTNKAHLEKAREAENSRAPETC